MFCHCMDLKTLLSTCFVFTFTAAESYIGMSDLFMDFKTMFSRSFVLAFSATEQTQFLMLCLNMFF